LRFPIIGHGFGPGGRWSFLRRMRRPRRIRVMIASRGAAQETQVEVISIF